MICLTSLMEGHFQINFIFRLCFFYLTFIFHRYYRTNNFFSLNKQHISSVLIVSTLLIRNTYWFDCSGKSLENSKLIVVVRIIDPQLSDTGIHIMWWGGHSTLQSHNKDTTFNIPTHASTRPSCMGKYLISYHWRRHTGSKFLFFSTKTDICTTLNNICSVFLYSCNENASF